MLCLFSLYPLWGDGVGGAVTGWHLQMQNILTGRSKFFLILWSPSGTLSTFSSSVPSLDHHPLFPCFFHSWAKGPIFFKTGQCSAWSQPGTWCEWEEADPLVVGSLTSKTPYFLLFELWRKCYAQTWISVIASWPLWIFSPCLELTRHLFILKMHKVDVLKLWFQSGNGGTPWWSRHLFWLYNWSTSLRLPFL